MKADKERTPVAESRLSDFRHPEMVYAATLRSPVAKGRIRSIVSPHLPRDYRFIVAEDIPGRRAMSFDGGEYPLLASESVSYRGEPIGIIAGPDRRRVEEAIALTRIDMEEGLPAQGHEVFDSSRIVAKERKEAGDVDAALSAAERIVSGEFRLGALDHYYPEPQGAAAYYDYDKLIILSSTQWPFHVRDAVAAALGVKGSEIVVRPGYLGPHLDGKLWYPSLLACHVAIVARLMGRPCLLQLSREEDFLYTTKRTPSLAAYRVGLDKEGRISAIDASVSLDTGAYSPLAKAIAQKTVETICGAYESPALRCKVWAVSSNSPPMGAYAGIGGASIQFAIERIADCCAMEAGKDPVAWRLENFTPRNEAGPTGRNRRNAQLKELFDELQDISDYRRKRSAYELIRKRRPDPEAAPGFGIGMAFGYQTNDGTRLLGGTTGMAVEATLDKQSRLTILTSVLPSDPRAIDLWKREAAETLDIEPGSVHILPVGTDSVPDSGAAAFSSGVSIITGLIADACEGIRSKRFREGLPITVRKTPRRKRRIPSALDGASWGGAVVELSVDPLEPDPVVRGIWMAVNAGRILSLEHAEQSMRRDIARALSNSQREHIVRNNPRTELSPLFSYSPLRIRDIPPIELRFVGQGHADSPGGIGELAFAAVPAAFANALSQALDRPVDSLPLQARHEERRMPR